MFFIRDAAGTSAEKQGAHGNAFDRVAAFQFGFAGSPDRCARIDEAEIKGRITQQPFSPDDPSQGQLPIGGASHSAGVAPIPPNSLAVRLLVDEKDIFLASGAHGAGAIYTDSGHMIHIIRKIIIRVGSKLDWLILKLH